MIPCAPLVAASLLALLPAQEDPVSPLGHWRGLARGDGSLVPAEGVAFELLVRPGTVGVEARMGLDGSWLAWAPATWDAEASRLELVAASTGVRFEVGLDVEAASLGGEASGLGMTVELEAELVGRELPPEPVPAEASSALPVDPASLSVEDWHADLVHLAETLRNVHKNAFHSISEAEWTAAVDALDERLPELGPLERVVALARLTARVGDAHTGLGWNSVPGMRGMQVRFRFLADGLFVTGVHEDFLDALAARVVAVGGRPIDEVTKALATTFAAENDSWVAAQVQNRIAYPALLQGLGILPAADVLPLTVEADGERLEVTIEHRSGGAVVVAPDPGFDEVPLWMQRTGASYWATPLASDGALYLAYNRCAEDPVLPMAGFFDDLLATFDGQGLKRLVIDLRNNSGGNSVVLSSQLEKLSAHPVLSRPGRVVTLIGPVTYSSGMMNAYQLHQIGSVLLGEPTGGKPNSYGEVRTFTLPRSGLPVSYSTKYFRMLPDEDPPAVLPDVRVALTSADYFTGADPVLEAALALPLEAGEDR